MSREERLPEEKKTTAFYYIHQKRYFLSFAGLPAHVVVTIPGLLDFALYPLTLVVSDVSQRAVDSGKVRFTHIKKVRAQAAHRHFGDVGERLADRTAKNEHSNLLVESRNVGVSHKRLGSFIEKVDPVAFPNNDLEREERWRCK